MNTFTFPVGCSSFHKTYGGGLGSKKVNRWSGLMPRGTFPLAFAVLQSWLYLGPDLSRHK